MLPCKFGLNPPGLCFNFNVFASLVTCLTKQFWVGLRFGLDVVIIVSMIFRALCAYRQNKLHTTCCPRKYQTERDHQHMDCLAHHLLMLS